MSAVFLGLLFGAVLVGGLWQQVRRLRPRLPGLPPPAQAPRITEAARLAADRVYASSPLLVPDYRLQDIGLVVDERRPDGVRLRHARFLSMDEESIRPYLVVHVGAGNHAGYVRVRFEIEDAETDLIFVYEMESLLRPGENLLLPDYRLRLRGNEKITQLGNWNLRISVNDKLVGVHKFNVLASMAERVRRITTDGELADSGVLPRLQREEALPVSLEELLNNQGQA
ncbi:MAG: hypothetical protein HC915_08650 [Anaerolineae bacterium]|nr:hypothetical protein [Anaerolineae bacterium]